MPIQRGVLRGVMPSFGLTFRVTDYVLESRSQAAQR